MGNFAVVVCCVGETLLPFTIRPVTFAFLLFPAETPSRERERKVKRSRKNTREESVVFTLFFRIGSEFAGHLEPLMLNFRKESNNSRAGVEKEGESECTAQ